MTQLINIRNSIRQFCRKQDEIVTPILRFIWTFLVFISLRSLFGYSALANKIEVIILLAIISALLPDGFLFFVSGVIIMLNTFSVSLEVGAVFVVMFALMYCIYVRFFPNYSYAVLIVPVFYMFHIPFAAPIVIALICGIGGLVPAVFGVIIYHFSVSTAEISKLLKTAEAENEIEAFKQLSEVIIKNKEMYTTALIFAMTILVTYILLKMSYDYAMYIAIAAGTIVNILGSIFAGYIVNQDVATDKVILGSVVGILLALLVRFGKGILDYKHTERVQFEDDDYYYYVKAVPKIDSEKAKNKKNRPAGTKTASKPAAKPAANPAVKPDMAPDGKPAMPRPAQNPGSIVPPQVGAMPSQPGNMSGHGGNMPQQGLQNPMPHGPGRQV